jgi:hypothetical protein
MERKVSPNMGREERTAERKRNIQEKKRLAEEVRRMEIDSRKKKISVDYNLFTHICKSGFVIDNLPNGRVDISFTKVDIIDMCKGKIVEKDYYGQVYQFLMINIDRIDMIEILKRSPLFQQIAETL